MQIIYTELSLAIFFIMELNARFVLSPDKFRFIKCPFNVLDICTNFLYFVAALVPLLCRHGFLQKTHVVDTGQCMLSVYISGACGIMRTFRLLKLSRCLTGVKVLLLVLKSSAPELVTLFVFLLGGMFIFSISVFYAELSFSNSFESIPIGYWWALVTMTTLGYGDIVPKGGLGCLVAVLCVVAGVMLIGLLIPIVGNNFATYYNYLKNLKYYTADRNGSMSSLNFGASGHSSAPSAPPRTTLD